MDEPADASVRSLIVGPACDGLRRTLGPLAWAALEVLTARAEDADGERVASISVRGLAAELAVAKDTAARSLAILRSEGLIAPRQGRGLGGEFAEASYVLVVPSGLTTVEASPNSARVALVPVPRASTAVVRRRRVSRSSRC